MGRRYRLEGRLLSSKRGPVLQMDDGGVWALDICRDLRALMGQRITVEGVRSGFDRIDVDWIDRTRTSVASDVQTFAAEADRERLTAPALKAFVRLSEQWQLNNAEAAAMLSWRLAARGEHERADLLAAHAIGHGG